MATDLAFQTTIPYNSVRAVWHFRQSFGRSLLGRITLGKIWDVWQHILAEFGLKVKFPQIFSIRTMSENTCLRSGSHSKMLGKVGPLRNLTTLLILFLMEMHVI